MKILAGRPKDIDDVVAIVATQGPALNLDRARATLRLLEKALDRGDPRCVLTLRILLSQRAPLDEREPGGIDRRHGRPRPDR